MRRTWFGALVVLAVLASAVTARAGDQPAEAMPTVVIRVKSIDTVLDNFKVLATLLGREQAAQDIQALIKAKVGAKGLQGIDLSRPVGAYVRFGKELTDLSGAVLVPVADTQAFLALLENVGMNPSKGKDGIYTLQTKQNIDLYLRFAKHYAFISGINTENLSDKNLLDPAKVLAGSKDSVLAMTLRLDQIPHDAKALALGQLEQSLQAQEKDVAGESAAQKELRKAMLKQMVTTAAQIMKDGQTLGFELAFQKEKKDLAIKMSMSAVPGSELAKAIADSGKHKSLFAGMLTKDSAVRLLVDASLPASIHESFSKAMADAAEKAVSEIGTEAKRQQAQALVSAILPSIKTGHLDAFFGMAGPVDKHYTMLAGIKVVDGEKLGDVIENLVRGELKTLSPEQQEKIKLNIASVGSVKIHKFEIPTDAKTGKVLEGLPGDANLFVAFRKDAVLLAIGPNALGTLKDAIAYDQATKTPLFLFDFNAARLAPTLAQTPEQRALAAKVLGAGAESDVRVTIDGGNTLSFQLNFGLDVLEFFAKMQGKE